MATSKPAVRFTIADYRTLPEGARYQLLEGDLIVSPAPSLRHQLILVRLLAAIHAFIEPRNLGRVYPSPVDVILSEEDVPQPDIAFVSSARLGLPAPEGIHGGPDLCVEILSPATAALDRGAKRRLYARHGVTEYWIVDGDAHRIEVYRLQEDASSPLRVFSISESFETRLLPGFTLDLRSLFAD